MTDFVKVGKVSDLDEGKGTIVWVNGTKVALFRCEGVFYAIRNQCPHMGGDLGEGYLEGHIVHCPVARLEVQREDRQGAGHRGGGREDVRGEDRGR